MQQIIAKLTTIQELFRFLWRERLWWLIPFIVVLLIIALILIFAQSSPIAPLLYSAF